MAMVRYINVGATSGHVVMDIAAFKISHSVGFDIDTTALRAKKWSA